MFYLLIGIQLAGVVGVIMTMGQLYRKKYGYHKDTLITMAFVVLFSALGCILEMETEVFEAVFITNQISHVGKCFVITLGLMFVIQYYGKSVPKYFFTCLFSIDSIVLVTVLLGRYNTLYFREYRVKKEEFFTTLDMSYGVMYYPYLVFQGLQILMFIYVCISEWKKRPNISRRIKVLVIVGVCAPPFGLFLNTKNVLGGYDFVVIGIELLVILLNMGVNYLGMEDTIQLAQETIITKSREGIFITDAYYKVLYANPALLQIFGKDGAWDAYKNQERMKSFVSRGKRIAEYGGSTYEISTAEIMEKNQVRGYITWLVDVSLMKMKSEKMEALKDKAERADAMKSEFMSKASGRIRIPINQIRGMTGLLASNEKNPENREYIHNIETASEELQKIVEEIVDYSKLDAGTKEMMQVQYYLDELMEKVLAAIDVENLTIALWIDKAENVPVAFLGDDLLIQKILTSVLEYLIQNMSDGRIVITIEWKTAGYEIGDLVVKIDVLDGVLLEDPHHAFENMRVHMACEYAEMMQGEVKLLEHWNKGHVFEIKLRQKMLRGEANHVQEQKRVSFYAPQVSIMVADDNKLILKNMEDVIKKYQISVSTANGGAELVQKIKKGEQYDLILVDYRMPDIDGIETAQVLQIQFQMQGKKTPVVVMITKEYRGMEQQFLNLGLDDVIQKPILWYDLQRLLEKWIPEDKRERVNHADRVSQNVTAQEPGIIGENLEEKESMNPQELGAILNKMQEGLDSLNYIAVCHCMQEMERMRFPEEYEDGRDALSESIVNNDLESVAELVCKMQEQLEKDGKWENDI